MLIFSVCLGCFLHCLNLFFFFFFMNKLLVFFVIYEPIEQMLSRLIVIPSFSSCCQTQKHLTPRQTRWDYERSQD